MTRMASATAASDGALRDRLAELTTELEEKNRLLAASLERERRLEAEAIRQSRLAAMGNMAAMVANPADLVQPRPESPSYTQRRSTVLGKYSKGEPTATQYPEQDKGKISDVGK